MRAAPPAVNLNTMQRPRSSGGRRPRPARARAPPPQAVQGDVTELSDGNEEVRAAAGAPAVIHTPAPPPRYASPMSAGPPGPLLPTPVAPLLPAAPPPSGRGRVGPRATRLQAAHVPPTGAAHAREPSSARGAPRPSADQLFAPDTVGTARPRSSGGRSFGNSDELEISQAAPFGSPVEPTLEEAATSVQNGKTTRAGIRCWLACRR